MNYKKILFLLLVFLVFATAGKTMDTGLERMIPSKSFDAVMVYEEDFSDNTLPDGWQNDDLSGSGHVWEFEDEKATANSNFSGSGDVHVHTALTSDAIDCSGLTVVKLGMKHRYLSWFEQNGKLEISADGQTWTLLQEYTSTTGDALAWEVIDISEEAAGEETVSFRWTFDDTELFGYYWILDEVVVFTPYDKDLNALEVTGNAAPTVGEENPFHVSVRNDGTEMQDDYQVHLYDADDNLIGTHQGEPIGYGETLTFDFTWIPNETGENYLYGVVDLEGDQIPGNNQTPNYPVNVQSFPTEAITVGDSTGTITTLPIMFNSLSSLTQTLYYPEEMGGGGLITTIAYHIHFSESVNNTPIKIWMAETETQTLANGWVDYDEMTLVFDDNMTFPAGSHVIYINLEEPFLYTGDQLAIMAFRPMDQWGFAGNLYNMTETPNRPDRSRRTNDNNVEPDPENPPPGTLTNRLPQTTFLLVQQGIGSLEGTVSDADGNPINQALIKVEETDFSAHSIGNGSYSIPYILEGEYDVTISKSGFVSQTHNITITEEQTTVLDVTMYPQDEIAVSGYVFREDNPDAPVIGATIYFEGADTEYEATTNELGYFELNAYGNQSYEAFIEAPGFLHDQQSVALGDQDQELEPFLLREFPVPAYEVKMDKGITYALAQWPDPAAFKEVPVIFDDGSAQNGFSSAPGYTLWMGNKFPIFDTGMIRSIQLYGLPHPYGWENEVTIQLFDKYKNHFFTTDPFVIKPDEWVTVELPMVPFDGEFWAMVNWKMLNTNTHHVGYDQTGPNADAQLDYFYDGDEWYLLHEVTMGDPGVFLIRVNAFIDGEIRELAVDRGTLQGLPEATTKENRDHKLLEHYKVFRRKLTPGKDEGPAWDTLDTQVSERQFVDYEWESLTEGGHYQYGVQAVYSFDNKSVIRPSASILKPGDPPHHLVTVTVTKDGQEPAADAEVLFTFSDPMENILYEGHTGNDGSIIFQSVTEGTYDLEVTYKDFEPYQAYDIAITSDTELEVDFATTGVGQTTLFDLEIYPNPARSHIWVRSPEAIEKIRLVGMNGQILKEETPALESVRLDTGNLPSGVYLLQVSTASGTQNVRIQIAH